MAQQDQRIEAGNGDEGGRAPTVVAAAMEVAPHVRAWIGLLERHVGSLPPDRDPSGHDGDEGSVGKGYALHELRAMRRGLGALVTALEG